MIDLLTCRVRFGFGIATLCFLCIHATAAETVNETLRREASHSFSEALLADALAQLSETFDVPTAIDYRTLRAAGIDCNTVRLTSTDNKQALGASLDDLLQPYELTWIVRHGVLFITTERAARERYFNVQLYQITRRVPVERRMRSIMWTIEPTSWVTTGGAGDAAPLPPKLLLVNQTPLRHRQIAARFAKSVVPVRLKRPRDPTPTRIRFENIPLKRALNQLGRRHQVNITLDEDSLQAADLDANDLLVTCRVERINRLNAELSLVLEQTSASLTWIADDSGVTVLTLEAASGKMTKQVYDARLVVRDGNLAPLMEAIQYTIAASSWEDVGGDGSIREGDQAGMLHISQSAPVHRELTELFARLQVANQLDGDRR